MAWPDWGPTPTNTAPTFPATVVDDASIGNNAWINPGNAGVEDAASATADVTPGESHYLKATAFGFQIPATATVLGVQARIKAMHNNGSSSARIERIRLVKGGVIQTTDRGPGASLTLGTLTWSTFGGAADLWGTTWTPDDVNASGFGVATSGKMTSGAGDTVFVDVLELTVFYTRPVTDAWEGARLYAAGALAVLPLLGPTAGRLLGVLALHSPVLAATHERTLHHTHA